jgi:hypothetical protein
MKIQIHFIATTRRQSIVYHRQLPITILLLCPSEWQALRLPTRSALLFHYVISYSKFNCLAPG